MTNKHVFLNTTFHYFEQIRTKKQALMLHNTAINSNILSIPMKLSDRKMISIIRKFLLYETILLYVFSFLFHSFWDIWG